MKFQLLINAIFTIFINQRWFELNKLANLTRKNQVNEAFASS
jgi:hypothetical protein